MLSPGRSSVQAILLCFVLCSITAAQETDSAGLGRLAQSLQDAYAKKDTNLVLALWSASSPQLAKLPEQLPKLFASVSEIWEEIASNPVVSGDRARFRATREVVQKGAATASGKKILVIECVKEPGGWKIWKESLAALDLAEQLIASANEAERQNLLSQNSDLPGPDVAFAVLDHGHDSLVHGNTAQAMAAFQLALSIAVSTGADSAEARALSDIGQVHYLQGDLQEAMEWFQKSLAFSESIHDDRAAARALNNAGNVYKDEGEFSLANDCYQKDLVLGDKLHDDMVIFNAVGNLGILSTERGDYVQALSYMKRAADFAERFGNQRGIALTLINMGQIFERQGDYAQAAAYTQRALDAATAADDRQKMGVAWMNLGTDDEFNGDLTNALGKFQKSLAIFEALGDKLHASSCLTQMGSVHRMRKEYAEAIELFQKSLHIQEEIGARDETAATLIDLAEAYHLKGDFEEALRTSTRAQELADSGIQIQPVWRAHLQRGYAYRGLGKLDRAQAEFAKSISVIEGIRLHMAGGESEQAGFFADRMDPYHSMIELLVTAGHQSEAFEYAEKAKARVLVDILKAGRPQLDSVLTAEERRKDQELRMKLASLNIRLMRHVSSRAASGHQPSLQPELQDARLEYAAFQTNLYVAHPEIKVQRGEMDPIRVDQAQRLVNADSAFVEFVVTSDKLFLFVSCGTGSEREPAQLQVFVQPIEKQRLGELVEQFRRQLADRDLRFRATASQLYQLVLGPARGYLKGKEKLIVVPDDVLWDLPFQALLSPTGRYLLEDYSVSYAPSLTALEAMTRVKQQRRHENGQAALLAMGNPAGAGLVPDRGNRIDRGNESGNLLQTENEVRQLVQIYGSSKSRVYVGREATESRFKAEAGGADVLHLATHGVLNNASPLYSYVLLAAGDKGGSEDGLLEASDLLQMQLRAELVVLSACETARGRVGAGEGVIGLSWALFVSGVPATVLSQWRVDSDSTTRLMTAFHRNRRNRMSDAEALRAAALGVRKDPAYQHPFYWAPFIMIGAGQ
jgi:CHAT domain-containing protein/tetratricopeptide (TPR) repeat protein